MDDDSYLAAIRAAPDDDAVRLVHADVLQARGDPRGELIALQVAQARARPGSDEAEALGDAVADLLAEHQDAWIPPSLRELPRHAITFRRGFIARVEFSADRFEACVDGLVAAAPVVELDLRGLHLAQATRLAAMPQLARIDALAVAGAPDPVCAALLASPHLAGLRSLTAVHVGPETETQLARPDAFPALESLHGVLQPAARRRLLASTALPALTRLTCPLDADDVAALGAPHRRARWTELHFVAARTGGEGLAALLGPGFPALRELSVSGAIGAANARAIAGASLPVLRHLGLSDAGIGADGVAALLGWPQAARLESLHLGSCGLTRDADPLLAGRSLPALRTLILMGNEIGPAGAANLAASDLGALESLSLRGTTVGDAGAAALAGSRTLGRLRRLDLVEARLSPAGVRALAEATGLAALRELPLTNQALDDRAVAALGAAPGLPSLRALDLGMGQFEPRWLEVLIRAPVLAQLVALECRRAEVTDRAVVALARNPAATRLRRLTLWETDRLTGASLLAIARSPYLTRLRELQRQAWVLDARQAQALLAAPGLCRLDGIRLEVPPEARVALAARFGRRVEVS